MAERLDQQLPVSQAPPGAVPIGASLPSSEAPIDSREVDAGAAARAATRDRILLRRSILSASVVLATIALGIVAGLGLSKLLILLAVPAIGVLVWTLAAFQDSGEAVAETFYDSYAEQRGMRRTDEHSLPESTPLLREGRRRDAPQVLRGDIGGGAEGTVALYRYFASGETGDTASPFAVALVEVPGCAEFIPQLGCYRKKRSLAYEIPLSISFWRTRELIKLESSDLAAHRTIVIAKGQDRNRVHQLFSPTFIEWLTTPVPEDVSFELENGVLCCSRMGYPKSFAELDSLRDAALGFASRLRKEVAESASLS